MYSLKSPENSFPLSEMERKNSFAVRALINFIKILRQVAEFRKCRQSPAALRQLLRLDLTIEIAL